MAEQIYECDPQTEERIKQLAEVLAGNMVSHAQAISGAIVNEALQKAVTPTSPNDVQKEQLKLLWKALDGINELRGIANATTCGECDWDEATGDLFNHCDGCCRKLTRELWRVLES